MPHCQFGKAYSEDQAAIFRTSERLINQTSADNMHLFGQNLTSNQGKLPFGSAIYRGIAGGILLLILTLAPFATAAFAKPDAHAKRSSEPNLRLFRPSSGVWYSQFGIDEGAFSAVRLGTALDLPVPADYDGDGEVDIAVLNPQTGVWNIEQSSDMRRIAADFGKKIVLNASDIPVPSDYDGDGMADIAFWRPESGEWNISYSSQNTAFRETARIVWGAQGDVPVPADYDGDGKTDLAVFRSSENNWYILGSDSGRTFVRAFGIAGLDTLVPADYTGDGKADPAVFRSGDWFVLKSENGKIERFTFGIFDSVPVPADYDGDGETDFAVFRQGMWYIVESSGTRFIARNFGLDGDIPINSLRGRPSVIGVP